MSSPVDRPVLYLRDDEGVVHAKDLYMDDDHPMFQGTFYDIFEEVQMTCLICIAINEGIKVPWIADNRRFIDEDKVVHGVQTTWTNYHAGGELMYQSHCNVNVQGCYRVTTPVTCLTCLTLAPSVETCGEEGCERGAVCGDGVRRCFRCGRQRG